MLDYFKKNPTALMDAIPTPPDEEEDDIALKDFHSGLTPKRNFQFKFGQMDPSGALNGSHLNRQRPGSRLQEPLFKRRISSASSLNTPNKQRIAAAY